MCLLQVDESDEQTIEPDPPPSIEQILETEHHLSCNALKGANGLGTLKFQGWLQGVMVQILVDSGSSDNFIQP